MGCVLGIEPNEHQIPRFQGKYSYHTDLPENPERPKSPNILTHALSAIGCVGHWADRKNIAKYAYTVHVCGRPIITRKTTADIRHAPSTVSGFVGLFLLCLTD